MNAVTAAVRGHGLAAFVGLTFAVSWTIWLSMILASLSISTTAGTVLNIVAIAGPSIAALILVAVLGRRDRAGLLAGFAVDRVSPRWAATAVAIPLLVVATAIGAGVAFFGTSPPTFSVALVGVVAVEAVRIAVLGGPLGEELGWRGFALPRLQRNRSAVRASVLLGAVWGLWHIPLYFVAGTGQSATLAAGTDPAFAIGGFVGWTIGLSVLFTWLWNSTAGSLWIAILFHTAVDVAAFMPGALGSTGIVSLLNVAVTWLVAALVIHWVGGRTLRSASRDPQPAEALVPDARPSEP